MNRSPPPYAAYPLAHPVVQAATNQRRPAIARAVSMSTSVFLLRRLNWTLPLANTASLFCATGDWKGARPPRDHRAMHRIDATMPRSGPRVRTRPLNGFMVSLMNAAIWRSTVYPHPSLTWFLRIRRCTGSFGWKSLLDSIHNSLRPGGLFHLYDFVGPDRFQWTDPQLEEMTAWLQSIPERYRVTLTGAVKNVVGRPNLKDMLAFDASKAAHSSSIEPSIAERFEIVERRALGGTLAMMALADIVHNFDPDSPEDRGHIERLLAREDELIGSESLAAILFRRGPAERLRIRVSTKEAPVAPGASRSEDPVHFSSTPPPTFDAVTADVQMTCAQHLKWIVDRCEITQSEISIGGWALRPARAPI